MLLSLTCSVDSPTPVVVLIDGFQPADIVMGVRYDMNVEFRWIACIARLWDEGGLIDPDGIERGVLHRNHSHWMAWSVQQRYTPR